MKNFRAIVWAVFAFAVLIGGTLTPLHSAATCLAGQVLTAQSTDGNWACTTPATGSIPAGLIAPFTGACPTGWTELAAAQGRMIVGLPTSGTNAGTVGTALTNLQDKAVTPTFTGNAFSSVINHTHTVTVNDPGHGHTQNAHSHASIQVQGGTTASTTGTHIMTSTATGGSSRAATSPEAANNATATNLTNTTGVTATTANPAGGVSSITPAGTISNVALSGLISYIQYRYCSKD